MSLQQMVEPMTNGPKIEWEAFTPPYVWCTEGELPQLDELTDLERQLLAFDCILATSRPDVAVRQVSSCLFTITLDDTYQNLEVAEGFDLETSVREFREMVVERINNGGTCVPEPKVILVPALTIRFADGEEITCPAKCGFVTKEQVSVHAADLKPGTEMKNGRVVASVVPGGEIEAWVTE